MDTNNPLPPEPPHAPIFDTDGQQPGREVDAQSVRRMSAEEQKQWFEQRAARGSRAAFDAALAFLSRPGGQPPEEDDRLP
ncbi:MAG TPA: hypothetical protein PLW24_01775 [Burkholderiaceae bacterium]|nr:hypothetical protein [Burkholderiaceae bacterium]